MSMKYKKHEIKVVYDDDVDGGKFYNIYKDGKWITNAWTLSNAKEFIDSFDGNDYHWNVLC